MNKEEFTKYLKSIGGVFDWKGRKHLTPNIFGVSEGWFTIIHEMIEGLVELGWDRIVYNSKEKFGGFRFAPKNIPEGGQDIILKCERASYTICEECGESGVLRKGDWMKTACDKHAKGEKFDQEQFKRFGL